MKLCTVSASSAVSAILVAPEILIHRVLRIEARPYLRIEL